MISRVSINCFGLLNDNLSYINWIFTISPAMLYAILLRNSIEYQSHQTIYFRSINFSFSRHWYHWLIGIRYYLKPSQFFIYLLIFSQINKACTACYIFHLCYSTQNVTGLYLFKWIIPIAAAPVGHCTHHYVYIKLFYTDKVGCTWSLYVLVEYSRHCWSCWSLGPSRCV